MPLTSTTHLAMTDIIGVSFLMADHERDCLVRVDVPREQLIALGSSAAYSPHKDLSAFEDHRDAAELIARQKYERRGYDDYANGRVVVLSADDWARHRATSRL
jgi:hypothetical protein